MLASPIIQGVLPAFYLDKGTAEIAVPFSMSRAVNETEVSGFSLKIKNIQGFTYLLTVSSSRIAFNEGVVYFEIPAITLKNSGMTSGSFYKAQLAYVDLQGTVGYYSQVAVIKYTTKPHMSILNLKESSVNAHGYEYVGIYSQASQDSTEKVYSYRFQVRDNHNVVVEDTGYLIHNNSNDSTHYESQDTFMFSRDLKENEKYTITYTVKTNNNLEVSSPAYKIMSKKAVGASLNLSLKATANFDNGYVEVSMGGDKDDLGLEKLISGSFALMRASNLSNYMEWEQLADFSLTAQRPSKFKWKDFTIQQGLTYQYSLQQYNKKKLYSERILSNKIYADFEDCFLFDGKRQLKIRYNSKMSSFKTTVLESKMNTLGAKYPFTFRSGAVEYKEFPIAGLVSYLMDEESLFMDLKELFPEAKEREEKFVFTPISRPSTEEFLQDPTPYYVLWQDQYAKLVDIIDASQQENIIVFLSTYTGVFYLKLKKTINEYDETKKIKTTALEGYNIATEREFKLQVLDWLNDGQPKLFKSPTEGNYIVRLINTSLSPNEQLGRMIHNFSTTAYEVADLTYDNLVKEGFVSNGLENQKQYFKMMTIPLFTIDENYVNISSIEYERAPGESFYYAQGPLLTMNSTIESALLYDVAPGTEFLVDGQSIIVGANGRYELPFEVAQIIIPYGQKTTGYLTVAYFTNVAEINSFDQILDATIKDVLGQQFIGYHQNVLKEIENVASEMTTLYDLRCYHRPIEDVYVIDDYVPTTVAVNKYNFMNFYIYDATANAYVVPEQYSWKNTHYSKQTKIYADAICETLLITLNYAQRNLPPEVVIAQGINVNPLNLRKYTKNICDGVNWPLYRLIEFKNTGALDATNNYSRAVQDRTVTNPYLKDCRDFGLMVSTQQLYTYNKGNNTFDIVTDLVFNPEINYYVAQPVEYLLDITAPTTLILTKDSYEGFEALWSTLLNKEGIQDKVDQQLAFETMFKKHQTSLFINSGGVDLAEKPVFSTGNIEKPKSIEITNGIYCELYYQKQVLAYNIAKIHRLTTLKNTLDDYESKISQEKMVELCFESKDPVAGEATYIENLNMVRQNYAAVYEEYITLLSEYLKSIEEV